MCVDALVGTCGRLGVCSRACAPHAAGVCNATTVCPRKHARWWRLCVCVYVCARASVCLSVCLCVYGDLSAGCVCVWQLGQTAMDEMSMLGLQLATGAAVDSATRGVAEGGGAGRTGKSFLLKRETDEQLAHLQEARAATATSLQVAQRTTSENLTALQMSIDAMTQQTLHHLGGIGENLPSGISPVGKPTMQIIGQVVGFTSVIGSWIVGGVSTAVDAGLEAAGQTVDAGIRGGESALMGVQTCMSAAQTEFVLGVEGAAIMENMINIHEAEFKHEYSDIGYMQLARGISAYSSLQQLARPDYIHAGTHLHLCAVMRRRGVGMVYYGVGVV